MDFRFLSLLAFAAVFLTACSEPPASEPSRNAVATEEAAEESPDDGPKQAAAKSGLASKPAPVAGPRIWSEVTLHEARAKLDGAVSAAEQRKQQAALLLASALLQALQRNGW